MPLGALGSRFGEELLISKSGGGTGAVKTEPGLGGFQARIHIVDIFHALVIEPVFEGFHALLGIDGDAFFPGGAAAEDA